MTLTEITASKFNIRRQDIKLQKYFREFGLFCGVYEYIYVIGFRRRNWFFGDSVDVQGAYEIEYTENDVESITIWSDNPTLTHSCYGLESEFPNTKIRIIKEYEE